jgi:hypothetical protein
VASGDPGDEREDANTATLLRKFPILIGQVQGQMMPMPCSCYIGCDLALLLSGGWWEQRKSKEL